MPRQRLNAASLIVAGLIAFAASGAASAAGFQDETLLAPIPKGFVLGDQGQSGPGSDIAEYIPQGETVDAWSRMITVQVFHNLKAFDPDRFAQTIRDRGPASRPGEQGVLVKHGREHGYVYALWLFSCPLNPQTGKPETFYDKLISGADALYSVQYSFRSTLPGEAVPATMAFLDEVGVCDTRLADRSCPTVRRHSREPASGAHCPCFSADKGPYAPRTRGRQRAPALSRSPIDGRHKNSTLERWSRFQSRSPHGHWPGRFTDIHARSLHVARHSWRSTPYSPIPLKTNAPRQPATWRKPASAGLTQAQLRQIVLEQLG